MSQDTPLNKTMDVWPEKGVGVARYWHLSSPFISRPSICYQGSQSATFLSAIDQGREFVFAY